MDLQKTAKEIGFFETARNLDKVKNSIEVTRKAGGSMPLPSGNINYRIKEAARWLRGYGKTKYMFLTPEIALIEEIRELNDPKTEIIIAIPCGLEDDVKERIRNNLPTGILITVLDEPYFPKEFFPSNSLMVICGYSGAGRAMVLSDTYRMVEHYSGFLGPKVFVPYEELELATRYDGWREVDPLRLSDMWRSEL